MRDRPNIINDLVPIFTCAHQPAEVQECVVGILEKLSKDHGEQAIIYSSLKFSLICRSFDTIKFRTSPLVASCRSRDERDEPEELCHEVPCTHSIERCATVPTCLVKTQSYNTF